MLGTSVGMLRVWPRRGVGDGDGAGWVGEPRRTGLLAL